MKRKESKYHAGYATSTMAITDLRHSGISSQRRWVRMTWRALAAMAARSLECDGPTYLETTSGVSCSVRTWVFGCHGGVSVTVASVARVK
jgi:hypothetical protein